MNDYKHLTHLVSPFPPPLLLANIAHASLPPDWQAHSDPTSKRTYYYNSKTGVSQWSLPTATSVSTPTATSLASSTTNTAKLYMNASSSSSSPSHHSTYPNNTSSTTSTVANHINYPHPSNLAPTSASKPGSGSKQQQGMMHHVPYSIALSVISLPLTSPILTHKHSCSVTSFWFTFINGRRSYVGHQRPDR